MNRESIFIILHNIFAHTSVQTIKDSMMHVGDLVRYCADPTDGRLGIVVSEVFDMRPQWLDVYPAVEVRTKHEHTGEKGVWMWMLEDIEVVSSV